MKVEHWQVRMLFQSWKKWLEMMNLIVLPSVKKATMKAHSESHEFGTRQLDVVGSALQCCREWSHHLVREWVHTRKYQIFIHAQLSASNFHKVQNFLKRRSSPPFPIKHMTHATSLTHSSPSSVTITRIVHYCFLWNFLSPSTRTTFWSQWYHRLCGTRDRLLIE